VYTGPLGQQYTTLSAVLQAIHGYEFGYPAPDDLDHPNIWNNAKWVGRKWKWRYKGRYAYHRHGTKTAKLYLSPRYKVCRSNAEVQNTLLEESVLIALDDDDDEEEAEEESANEEEEAAVFTVDEMRAYNRANHPRLDPRQNSHAPRIDKNNRRYHGPVATSHPHLLNNGIHLFDANGTNVLQAAIAKASAYIMRIATDRNKVNGLNNLLGKAVGPLGYAGYEITQGAYNRTLQMRHTAHIIQPSHLGLLFELPGFFEIKSAVESLHKTLSITAVDVIRQDFRHGQNGATDYSWHQDTDMDNNPSCISILRTVIVKLTPGPSAMEVMNHAVTEYDVKAGSYADFRSDAYHRSVVTNGTDHIKVVFFMGLRAEIDDGRFDSKK
jgi:hypothetical protein